MRTRVGKRPTTSIPCPPSFSEVSDTRSALEAEAYASWMGGNLLLEKESDWPKALALFTRAK